MDETSALERLLPQTGLGGGFTLAEVLAALVIMASCFRSPSKAAVPIARASLPNARAWPRSWPTVC